MTTIQLSFERLRQGVQHYGTLDDFMYSEIDFRWIVDGKWSDLLTVALKQTVGTQGVDGAVEIVKRPPLRQFASTEFDKCVSRYYQRFLGPGGAISIVGSVGNVIMVGNTMESTERCQYDVDGEGSSGW